MKNKKTKHEQERQAFVRAIQRRLGWARADRHWTAETILQNLLDAVAKKRSKRCRQRAGGV